MGYELVKDEKISSFEQQTKRLNQFCTFNKISIMKKLLFLSLIFIQCCLTLPTFATHLSGGEITWKCAGNGQYVFTLKVYYDCTGIAPSMGPYFLKLSGVGSPLDSIACSQVAAIDLSPTGCGNSCINPNGVVGLKHGILYQSTPVILSGTPPPTGWTIYTKLECCRNMTGNVSGGAEMVLRSVMYPYNATSIDPCFDSSPDFNEKPMILLCTNTPVIYNPAVTDLDHDSLVYSFDYPYSTNGGGTITPMTFIAPYTVNSPLPGNPVINPHTGQLTITPNPVLQQGSYSFVIKVTSYRCNIKIAEVFRESQVFISSSICSPVIDPFGNQTPNLPPVVDPAPFIDPVTGNYTLYVDTIDAGDSIQVFLNVQEDQAQLNGTPQQFWVDAVGVALDTGSVVPYVNCEIPPCAYLDQATPSGPFVFGSQIRLKWVTNCQHLVTSCGSEYTPYNFVIKVRDDGCPLPATNYVSFTVVVRGLQIKRSGDTLSVTTPFTNLQWYLNGVAVPGATGNTYITPTPGFYSVQAISGNGCILNSNPYNQLTVGIDETISILHGIQVSPNPAKGLCTVNAPDYKDATLYLYDVTGRAVVQLPFNIKTELNISTLPDGVFVVEIKDEKGNCVKSKLVKD